MQVGQCLGGARQWHENYFYPSPSTVCSSVHSKTKTNNIVQNLYCDSQSIYLLISRLLWKFFKFWNNWQPADCEIVTTQHASPVEKSTARMPRAHSTVWPPLFAFMYIRMHSSFFTHATLCYWSILAMALSVCLWLSVCHKPVLYRNGWTNQDRRVFAWRLPSTYHLLCFKEIRVFPKMGVGTSL